MSLDYYPKDPLFRVFDAIKAGIRAKATAEANAFRQRRVDDMLSEVYPAFQKFYGGSPLELPKGYEWLEDAIGLAWANDDEWRAWYHGDTPEKKPKKKART